MLAAALVAAVVAAACGKKGDPLPPFRPVPERVADLTAHRVDDRIDLQFTVPPTNVDGSTPPALDRVEIYAITVAPDAPAPAADQVIGDPKRLRATVLVRPAVDPDAPVSPAPDPAASAPASPLPAPGGRASFSERVVADASSPAVMHYVAVAVAGRNRRGATSPVVAVPLANPPAAPSDLSVTHDETNARLTWTPTEGVQTVRVIATAPVFDPETAKVLTPTAIATGEYTEPVAFARERCFALRSVRVTGQTTVDGPVSSVTCLTAVDRYPPPQPANLQAIQEGDAVTLNWTPVDASDLVGYIVLRGDATGENMQPLMRQPARETTYRDATVQPGATHTYTVYAVDNALTPNVSQQSNRQVVTMR